MPQRIIMHLTPKSINEAIKAIKQNRKEVDKKYLLLVDKMVAAGEVYAINEVGHVDTGETLASIMGYREGNRGVIVAGGAAIWIEFGTGVYKNAGNEPHPKAAELGMSKWGEYGDGHGGDPNGWWYKDENDEVHHTNGIFGNKFMYRTAQYLKQIFAEKAREVFK